MHCNKRSLFDHLVDARKQGRRYFEAHRLRGSKVDDRCLHQCKSAGLASKYAVDVAIKVSECKLVLPSAGRLLAIFVKRNSGILLKAGLAAGAEHPKNNGDKGGNEKQKKYRHRHYRLL